MLPSGRGATAIQLGGPPSDCTTGVGHFAAGGGVGGGMIIAVFTTIPLPGASRAQVVLKKSNGIELSNWPAEPPGRTAINSYSWILHTALERTEMRKGLGT
jgi:hypothetical protein